MGKTLSMIETAVRAFSKHMLEKLRANDHKPNWRTCSLGYLRARLDQELDELDEALKDGDPHLILGEAADVANFAMMIGDVAMNGHRKGVSE